MGKEVVELRQSLRTAGAHLAQPFQPKSHAAITPGAVGREVASIGKAAGHTVKGLAKVGVAGVKKIKRGTQILKARKAVKRKVASGLITASFVEPSNVLSEIIGNIKEGYKAYRAYRSKMKKLTAKELEIHDVSRARRKAQRIKTRKVIRGKYTPVVV